MIFLLSLPDFLFFFSFFCRFLPHTGAPPVPINKCAKCDKTVYKAEEVRTSCVMFCDTMLYIVVPVLHCFLSFTPTLLFFPFDLTLHSSSSITLHSPLHSPPSHTHTHIGVLLRRCVAQELLYLRCAV